MKFNLGSKTHQGVFLLVLVAGAFAWFGRLTPELADILKYVAGGFFAVRAVSNYSENKSGRTGQ